MTDKVKIGVQLKEMGCDFDVPDIYLSRDDDGSFTVEWIFPGTRIGLSIGPKPDEHGWFVVGKQISASGPLELGMAIDN